MKTKNLIGLDSENAQQVVNLLNELLANYQIYYQNLRGFHWNVRGNRFFVLHAKFEELYNDAIEKVDEIAERILTLGGVPLHSYAAYTKVATLKAKENVTDGDACLRLEYLGSGCRERFPLHAFPSGVRRDRDARSVSAGCPVAQRSAGQHVPGGQPLPNSGW